MVQYDAQLKDSIFSFLQEDEARDLFHVMDERFCKSGTILFEKDDPAECLYFVITGKIAVQKRTGFGERTQVVALLGTGAPIGEGGLLEEKLRGSTLFVVQDSRLLVLEKSVFQQLSSDYSGLAVKILRWLLARVALRLQKSSERLAYVL